MLKQLIEQLVAEAAKKPEAKAKLTRTHFITVWRQGDRFRLRITWTSGRLDDALAAAVTREAGWPDWRFEIGTQGMEYSGLPSVPDQPTKAKSAKKREGHFINREQQVRMLAIAGSNGLNHADVKTIIDRRYGAKSTLQLTPPEYEEMCDVILPGGRPYLDSVNWFQEGHSHAS